MVDSSRSTQQQTAQHTPGPWTVHPDWPGMVVPLADAGKKNGAAADPDFEAREYAKIIHDDRGTDYPQFHRSRVLPAEAKANARLIAAAPELLETLKVAAVYIGAIACQPKPLSHKLPDVFAACRAAIAKAEGRDVGRAIATGEGQ